MANKTTNFELTKPLPEEFYDVAVQNGNMDIIDAQLKKLQDEKVSLVGGKIPAEQLPGMDVDAALSALDTKAAPADGDGLVLTDSAAKNAPKRLLWSGVKTALGKLFAAVSHQHTKAEISDFPAAMPPNAHTHPKADITDFPASLPASDVYPWAKAATKPGYTWSEIGGKPSVFTPAAHRHTKSDITDFPASLPASGGNADTVGGKNVDEIIATASDAGAKLHVGSFSTNRTSTSATVAVPFQVKVLMLARVSSGTNGYKVGYHAINNTSQPTMCKFVVLTNLSRCYAREYEAGMGYTGCFTQQSDGNLLISTAGLVSSSNSYESFVFIAMG